MKLFVSFLLLATSALAQSPIAGTWAGSATVHGQQVPVRLAITGNGADLHAALLNGPENSPASSAVFKVPANVLLFRGDGMHVATVGDNGQVVMKSVTIGRDYGSDIEIVQGLTADDKVILSPPD